MLLVIVVALSNLALGFLAALYLGRGPRHWSDVDRAVQFKTVEWKLPTLGFRRFGWGKSRATRTAR